MSHREDYAKIKEQHPDNITLLRIGDFMEAFDDDARTVAKVCDIVLCFQPIGDKRVPLAGFPYWQTEQRVQQLLDAGYKVAIGEYRDTKG